MSVLVDLDFTKETLSKTILDFFRNGLQGNPDQSGSKQTYEECLRTLSQGKKLQYGAANYLLLGIVRSLGIENSPPNDEFLPGERQDDKELGIDPTMSQIMADASSQKKKMDTTQDQDDTIHGSEEGASGSKLAKSGDEAKNDKSDRTEKQVSRTTMPKKKELCRFYARGHCTRSKECRFDHPTICNKFRKNGSISTNPSGCDGKCKSFHLNTCRSSLQHKTCSFQECRFFHLKGTKRSSNPDTNRGSSRDSNWRSNQERTAMHNNRDHQRNQGQNRSRTNAESNNRFASFNHDSKNWNPNLAPVKKKMESETPEDRIQLGQTLQAIMQRLSAMESRQMHYQQPTYQPAQPIQPLMSPAVPQPGTQTQNQWASQPPWTQTQTQY